MKPVLTLILSGTLAFATNAQESEPPVLEPIPAEDVTLDEFLWQKRPVVVFADSANDPAFQTQLLYLAEDPGELIKRDVIILTDTDPRNPSEVRRKLRPRGFSMVLLDKDGAVKLRKPLPWQVREIVRAIDKFPLRQQEIRDRQILGR
ncbi:hypothetical protein DEA8626_02060 [Defluviimonas aquaemixtae]|uniref:DUF4174 domain-containing protein n=1 Tax=Albidovulum aquaemixtae TaxID=1542388 RepID=A0A2R8B7C8_9RHOB|nr:DUF4174 domain-containing protein [Defluviimonas aquaemixtae]SPH18521.1 hypothetical protein DEA8626_02060 [Defluviimonas aquaemixtae]